MSDDRNHFLLWEATTRDTIDFKKIYVDMTHDIVAGLMLSEIVYWHLPSKRGENKLRVQKQGEWWIAVSRAEWWDRIRLSPRQADTAIKKLIDCNLIEKRLFKFDGQPTVHVRLLWDNFLTLFKQLSENPILQNGESGLTKNDNLDSQKTTIPLTEITAEITEKPLSPATQDDGLATLPTTVESKKQTKPPSPRLLKRDVSSQLVPVLFKYGKGRTLESYSNSEVSLIMRNQFTPLLKALQTLDDEQHIDAMELDAAYKWFRKQYKDASYPCGSKTVVKMLADYRAYKRSQQKPKPHLDTTAIDGLLAQPAPTYAVDINDVRIIGEIK